MNQQVQSQRLLKARLQTRALAAHNLYPQTIISEDAEDERHELVREAGLTDLENDRLEQARHGSFDGVRQQLLVGLLRLGILQAASCGSFER